MNQSKNHTVTLVTGLCAWIAFSVATVQAQVPLPLPYPTPYPNQFQGQPTHQPNLQRGQTSWGPAGWMQNMKNQFVGKNSQYGNIFQDNDGFFKWMGDGKTRYKFYFDVDFQIEMDAWMKSRNRANQQIRQNQQQYWNHQGQVAPGYQYRGQGYYQGYVYPQPGIPNYYGRPAPQR